MYQERSIYPIGARIVEKSGYKLRAGMSRVGAQMMVNQTPKLTLVSGFTDF
jgi:hypothetical protein